MTSAPSQAPAYALAVLLLIFAPVLFGGALWSSISALTALAPRGFDWGVGAFFGMAAASVVGSTCLFIAGILFILIVHFSRKCPPLIATSLTAYILTALVSFGLMVGWIKPAADPFAALILTILLSIGAGLIGGVQFAVLSMAFRQRP